MNIFLANFVLMQANAQGSNPLIMFGLFAVIILVFYFLMIRPQKKKQNEMKKMIDGMKKGDKVITIGGVHASVFTVKEKTVVLKVDDNTKMEFSKAAISTVLPREVEEKAEVVTEASSETKQN